MEWLAVAMALVPGVLATTLALMASQTLTTVNSSGARCRARRAEARSAVVMAAIQAAARSGVASRRSMGRSDAEHDEGPLIRASHAPHAARSESCSSSQGDRPQPLVKGTCHGSLEH